MTERRLGIVRIDSEHLIEIFTTGAYTAMQCVRGIPEGAVPISTHFDIYKQSAYVVFEHPSLPMVRSGDVLPEIDIELCHIPKVTLPSNLLFFDKGDNSHVDLAVVTIYSENAEQNP